MTLAQRTFDELGTPLHEVTFCILDLETTGGSPSGDEITEIGAVKYRGGQEIGSFQTMVNPGRDIPPFVTILTGITHAMVVEAPKIGEALPSFLEFMGDSIVVGHNVRFDLGFLNAAALRLGYGRLPHRSVDTAALARRLIRNEVRNLKLGTLAGYFRSPVTPNHRALEDAKATAHVLHALLERVGALGVTALEDLLQLPTARGSAHYEKIRLADELPRRPGVYMFLDRNGAVFYIGKAKNLRTRVRSYFYGDTRRSITNMLRELDSIEYRICETELEAEITEIRLIHAHKPRHNRRSKPPKASHWVKLTDEAFPRLSIVRTLKENGLIYLGPFRSRRTAEMVVHALWDATQVRRCSNRPGSRQARCAPSQLGVAKCPCDGSMAEAEYRPVVETLTRGIEHEPALLLDPLKDRMLTLSADQRFEEAGWVRDRYRALATALRRRRSWQALCEAGVLAVERSNGEAAMVERGMLVAAWRAAQPQLMPAPSAPEDAAPEVPPSVSSAEEAQLLWRWIANADTRLVDSTGSVSMPARPVPEL